MTDDFERAPGNPWIPCTLWLAHYRIRAARSAAALRGALNILEWTARQARPSGLLPKQLHPLGRELVSVCPLSWSHAEFVIAVRDYAVRDYMERRPQLASSKH